MVSGHPSDLGVCGSGDDLRGVALLASRIPQGFAKGSRIKVRSRFGQSITTVSRQGSEALYSRLQRGDRRSLLFCGRRRRGSRLRHGTVRSAKSRFYPETLDWSQVAAGCGRQNGHELFVLGHGRGARRGCYTPSERKSAQRVPPVACESYVYSWKKIAQSIPSPSATRSAPEPRGK